jgi:ATP-binding cassette subfamily F protein 3
VDAVDALTRALRQYEGTIVFISHDIYFVRCVANVVFDVQSGKVRKIPGGFDYYLEKKAKGELLSAEPYRATASKAQREKPEKAEQQKLRLKEEEKRRLEEEKRRKAHNTAIRKSVTKLENKKENLRLEMYAKSRVLSDPRSYRRRDEDTAKEYGRRIKEIQKLMAQIDEEIKKQKSAII